MSGARGPLLAVAAAVAVAALPLSGCGLFRSKPATSGSATDSNAARTVTRPGEARANSARGLETVEQAKTLKEQGRDDEALVLLARAIEVNPTLTVAHMEMGDIYEEKGDYKSAQKRYERAADLEPSSFDAQYKNGLMLQLMERFTEAVRAYLRALTLRPEDPQANLNLATAYLQQNEPAQALPYAQRSVQYSPRSGPAYANLGSVYSALGRHEEAVRAYESAAELTELTPALLLNLAEGYGKTERYEQMNNTLEALIASHPTAAAQERRGFALFKLRRYSESEQAFRASLAIDDRYYPALNGLGVCLLNEYINSGKENQHAKTEAVELLRKSVKINKSQPKIMELLGRFS
ncbi:MAG TPA: tetratricopeptide repeat protein [Phycisphaerales bacterium]|nr:tetratricopeptide repeat protein [Phycisphaerales bacterium]